MAGKFQGKERRQNVRLDEEFPVKFKVLSESDKKALTDWIESKTRNVSIGGIAIEVPDLSGDTKEIVADKKNLLEIEISLPKIEGSIKLQAKPTYVKTIGQIKWDQDHVNMLEIGIQFVNITEESIEAIKKFIVNRYVEKYKE